LDPPVALDWLQSFAIDAGFDFQTPAYQGGDLAFYFYNATWTFNPGYSELECALAYAEAFSSANVLDLLNLGYTCGYTLHDLSTAAGQLDNVLNSFPVEGNPYALNLSDIIKRQISLGRGVILVGHSQGNLMVQEALHNLYTSASPMAARCVSVVALAAPTSASWPVGGETVAGVAVKGQALQDIILELGLNAFPTASTDVSDSVENEVSRAGPVLGPLAVIPAELFLHTVVESYLKGDYTQQWITNTLGAERGFLRNTCHNRVTIAPTVDSVAVGNTVQVTDTVKNPLDSLLTGIPVTWRSSNPTIAMVDQTGIVTGNQLGTDTIWAVISGDSASATITVTPLAPVSASGISAGLTTCGVTPGGAAFCWGNNADGEIGDGDSTHTSSATPVAVSGNLTFAGVSSGTEPTCGATTSGAAYCWGNGGYGDLGIGMPESTLSTTPVAVSGGLAFISVSTGDYFTCGLTPGGAVYCWGANYFGNLGDGTATGPQQCLINQSNLEPCSTIPVLVSGGHTFASVSVGTRQACGVTTAGAAYCWGDNSLGELGNGTTTGPEQCADEPGRPGPCSTTSVAVSGGLTFASVSAGGQQTCGVTAAGAMYCWGDNTFGNLGDGTTTGPQQCAGFLGQPGPACSTTPVAVSGGLTFQEVSSGANFTCGLTTSGIAYCWGANNSGELGNGTTTSSTRPVAVSGGLTFASLSAGLYSACGVTTAGAAYCWGDNNTGELGDGTYNSSTTPVAVSGGLTFATGRSMIGVPRRSPAGSAIRSPVRRAR
jgi:alpha-tubulin suppressor-like RCC1 family protein